MSHLSSSRRGPRKEPRIGNLSEMPGQTRPVGEGGTRRVYNHNRGRGYINPVCGKARSVVAMVLLLQRNGIFVPRSIKVYQEYPEYGHVEFEKGGKTFADFLAKFPAESERIKKMPAAVRLKRLQQRKQANYQTLAKVFRMMGKVHRLGICHRHPHAGNIIIQGNKVGLIDFKLSSFVPQKEIWTSAEKILSGFRGDYEHLRRTFHILSLSPAEQIKCWGRMINQYPCSQEIKQQVLKGIVKKYPLPK